MIDWNLRPLQGIGPLTFGSSPAEVDHLLGPPRFEKHYSPTDYRQSRGKGAKGYDVILGFDPKILTDATFPAQPNKITIIGINIFHADPDMLISALKRENGGVYTVFYGSLFGFEQLGIVLNDWCDLNSSDRWIAAGSNKGYRVMVGSDEPDEIIR